MRPGRSSPSATPCPRRSATGDAAARQGGRPLSKSSQDIKVALKAQRGGPPHRPVLAGRPPTSSQPTSPLDNPNLHRESETRTSCHDQVILVDETAETVRTPLAAKTSSNARVNLLSRSRTRNRGALPGFKGSSQHCLVGSRIDGR